MIQFSSKKELQPQHEQSTHHRIHSTPPIIPSQYKTEYLTAIESYLPSPSDIKLLQMDLLKKGKIQIDRNHFEPKMVVQISDHSSNYEAILFKVSHGYFRTTISVLIVEGTSHSHNLPVIYNNLLNKIFTFESKPKKLSCIKCVQVKEKLHQRFNYVLNEVYLQKIAAVLKIGPSITPLFGFDIVIYSNCIEFAMQKCRKIETINNQDTILLKQKLATMHSFGLIHNDIKPSNIMVSEESREICFIDFGLSTHIKEQIGYKTTTRFSGTLEYCGSQMMKAYKNMQAEAVDLYYNDLFCLINSIRQLQLVYNEASVGAKNEDENGQNTMLSWKNFLYYQNYHEKAELYFNFMQIKYMLFTKQIINKHIFSEQEMREHYFLKICDFLEMLPKSNYSRSIQNLFIAIQEKYGLQYFMRAVELRLPKMLKQEPQIDFTQQSDQDQIYTKTIRTIYAHQHENYEYIKKGDNGRNWLHNYKEVKQTNRLNLIRGFCNYIDFRKTLSSFDEKVQAAKQLMLTINPSLLTTIQSQQKCLVVCLRYLLRQFIQSKQPYHDQIIPMMIRNLIMLNEIEYSEITQIIKQLLGASIDTLTKFMLKIRLQLLFQWAEKYWYSSKNNLPQNISQMFHIKIHQPFFTIIKKMHQLIFTFVSRTYTQIYNQVSKLFAAIYVGQEFIDQLIIWQICYLGTGTSFSSQSRYESLYLNKASLIGNHNRKYNFTFDFYYVNLYGFRNRHTTSQFITQFYHRFSRCLQKQQLMQHFYIYYEYHQNNLMCNEVSLQMKQSYFLQVIRTLPPLLVLVQPQSTYDLNDAFFKQPFSILLLIQIYEFSKSMQANQIPALFAQLRRYFTPTVLREVCPCIKLESFMEIGTKNRHCFMFISMIAYFYSILYTQQPFYPQQLSFYCSHLQTKLSQLKTKQDWQLIKIIQIQKVIVDSRCKIYNIKKQYTSIIRQFQLYLKKYLALNGELFLISRYFNLTFLTLIYETTIHLPSQVMETYQWYCDTIMKYSNFTALFQSQKGLLSLYYINSYLLTSQQYSTFLYFHSRLAVYMSQFVYIDQLKIYILSLQDLRLFKNLPTKQLWVLLNNNFNSYVNNQDTYFILLTSLLLSMSSQLSNLEVQSPGITNKWRQWLDFISSKVEKAVYDAKLFVLQNVYSYLLESAPAKVQITRNYVKYSKVVMKQGVFMRNMRSKLSRYHSESRRYVQGISVSLKKWHFYATRSK